jgi:hypothetical protein
MGYLNGRAAVQAGLHINGRQHSKKTEAKRVTTWPK